MDSRFDSIVIAKTATRRQFQGIWAGYGHKTQLLPKGWRREPGRRAVKEDIIWEKDVPISMRDGVRLQADVFRPARLEGQKLPTLLAWSPYDRRNTYIGLKTGLFKTTDNAYIGVHAHQLSGLEKFEAPDPVEWCPRGYAIMQPDARGCFNSEGDIAVFGTAEGRDGYDTIEWVAQQNWSNGSVGLVGNSWLAIAAWFIAAEQPPHLKAIAPWEGLGDFYREHICRGGIPDSMFFDLITKTFCGKNDTEDVVTMIHKHPLMNKYWEDKNPRLENIVVPMYVLGSYSTPLHIEGSIRGWKYSNSKDKWLRIHPTHEWFDIYQQDSQDDLQRFMDRYLLGKDNGWESTPKVRLSLLRYNGPPLSFRPEEDYPPKRTKYETLYLESASRKLQRDLSTMEAVASYQSDIWEDDGLHFTYTFDTYTELCGFSKAKLFMSCNEVDDMDVYVIIRKLDSDGRALFNFNIPFENQLPGVKAEDIPNENNYKYVGPSGRLRASKRLTAEEPGLSDEKRALKDPTELWYPHYGSYKVPAGDVVELDIALWPGGIIFEPGESLRFEIKGHNPILPELPQMKRNFKNLNIGRHNLHTGPKYYSSIILPLIY